MLYSFVLSNPTKNSFFYLPGGVGPIRSSPAGDVSCNGKARAIEDTALSGGCVALQYALN